MKEKFDEIKILAKRSVQPPVASNKMTSTTNKTHARCDIPLKAKNENEIELAGEELMGGTDNVDEIQRRLKEKVSELYQAIVDNADDTGTMHKASRFEIKSRCILHPHDIFGCQISKTIESPLDMLRISLRWIKG